MISEQDFKAAADEIQCKVSRIKAFYKVESNGSGYLDDGDVKGKHDSNDRLKILFEGHRFWKQLKKNGFDPEDALKRYPQYSNILYKNWTKVHYKGGIKEWERWSHAIALCKQIGAPVALAINSASYGAFQILGENYALCGYQDAQQMLTAYNSGGEIAQLKSCLIFLAKKKLIIPLRNGDWKVVADGYNGTASSLNNYAQKLSAADKLYS